jgi:hypothetical protein
MFQESRPRQITGDGLPNRVVVCCGKREWAIRTKRTKDKIASLTGDGRLRRERASTEFWLRDGGWTGLARLVHCASYGRRTWQLAHSLAGRIQKSLRHPLAFSGHWGLFCG